MTILVASSEIYFTESSNGKTVINPVFDRVIVVIFINERIEEFSFLDKSFLQTESVVKVNISID